MALESSWEAYENTDTVVNRYRAATISLGYYGDSLINSALATSSPARSDSCWRGACRGRRRLAWVIAIEIILAFWIRDNLTLNIIMLLHPFDIHQALADGGLTAGGNRPALTTLRGARSDDAFIVRRRLTCDVSSVRARCC